MSIDRIVTFAGTMVLLSLLLARLFSPWWLLLTAFVGVNLRRRPSRASAHWRWHAEARRQIRRSLPGVIDVQHGGANRSSA
jgi:hypothetical protein